MTLHTEITRTDSSFAPHIDSDEIIELNGFEVHRLEDRVQTVHVLAGCAWLTIAGRDVFVTPGEERLVFPERESMLISSPNFRQLVFEVSYR